ncbi:MAG: hypothetical protein OEZ07_02575 [Dehalococcoidia bacterium]|nr:hypothetical protein [Dehalococcoidia bacterium]
MRLKILIIGGPSIGGGSLSVILSRRLDQFLGSRPAASAVNVVGRMKGDWSELWDVPDGADVFVEKKTDCVN